MNGAFSARCVCASLCVILALARPDSTCVDDLGCDAEEDGGKTAVMFQSSSSPHSVDGSAISSYTRLLQNHHHHRRHDHSHDHWSGDGKGWIGRFPKLEAAVKGASHAERCAAIWKALGKNHWMKFIDGRAHSGGPHVFDDAHSSFPGRKSGKKTLEAQDRMYHKFSKKEAWESRWTVEKLAWVNAFYQRKRCRGSCSRTVIDHHGSKLHVGADEKKSRLTQILKEYYDAIDAIPAPMSDRGGGTHIQHALPYIAVLYHKLALLHPFSNGNSRTRTMVLQTELVRQGGHPVVLWDNYWGIYKACPGTQLDTYGPVSAACEQLQVFVLDGWCGWETTYNTNASPFSPFVKVDETSETSLSTPHSEYNADTGACEVGPKREFWAVPFDKNNPDEGYAPLPASVRPSLIYEYSYPA